MLHRVFGFADLTAGQVMIPRTELVAVSADTPLRELLRKIGQGEPTRLPVYRQDLDDVIGMLHVVDLVKALGGGAADVNAGALAREVFTVPITLGANTFNAEGEFTFDQGFADALRAWINAQATTDASPAALETATLRLRAANDAAAAAVTDNTPQGD